MGKETGHILGEIAEDEHGQGRPLLSAVAVGVSGDPGDGFFRLAGLLGKLKGTESKEEKRAFWEAETKAAYEVWQRRLYGADAGAKTGAGSE